MIADGFKWTLFYSEGVRPWIFYLIRQNELMQRRLAILRLLSILTVESKVHCEFFAVLFQFKVIDNIRSFCLPLHTVFPQSWSHQRFPKLCVLLKRHQILPNLRMHHRYVDFFRGRPTIVLALIKLLFPSFWRLPTTPQRLSLLLIAHHKHRIVCISEFQLCRGLQFSKNAQRILASRGCRRCIVPFHLPKLVSLNNVQCGWKGNSCSKAW